MRSQRELSRQNISYDAMKRIAAHLLGDNRGKALCVGPEVDTMDKLRGTLARAFSVDAVRAIFWKPRDAAVDPVEVTEVDFLR